MEALIPLWKVMDADPFHRELECHFGRWEDPWHSSLNQLEFEELLQTLGTCSEWSSVERGMESKDLVFKDGTRISQQQGADGHEVLTWIKKRSLASLYLHADGTTKGMHITVREEWPLQPRSVAIGTVANPLEWVRLKRRTSFIHSTFRYDCTITQSAPTEDGAPMAEPVYEVEVEFRPPPRYRPRIQAEYYLHTFWYRLMDVIDPRHEWEFREREPDTRV